jgi:hypothetical protein
MIAMPQRPNPQRPEAHVVLTVRRRENYGTRTRAPEDGLRERIQARRVDVFDDLEQGERIEARQAPIRVEDRRLEEFDPLAPGSRQRNALEPTLRALEFAY